MHRRRSRLRQEHLRKDHKRGSKFNVPGSTSPPQPGTRNAEPETPKVNDGTTDQYYRVVFSILDALRFDRHRGGAAGTVVLCPDGTRSLCRPASANLFEPWHSRYSRALGSSLYRLTTWLKIKFRQTQAVVPLAE